MYSLLVSVVLPHCLDCIFLPPTHLSQHREDAQAPKRVSWAKSTTGSDIISKNGTLSSIATSPPPRDPHHIPNNHYPYPPGACDTASVLTASGSTAAYRLRPGEPNPLHGLPGYNGNRTPTHTLHHHHHPQHHHQAHPHTRPPSSDSNSTHMTEGAQPQAPRPNTTPINSATLSRMGAVPVLVPSQNQAGSLV